MKILKRILIIILISITLTSCSNRSKEEEKLKEKIIEEIFYIDTKIVEMLNELNNILLQNYQITSKEVELSKENEKSQSIGTEGENSGTQNSAQAQNTEEKNMEVFELSQGNILGNTQTEIDWQKIKTNIELINTSWNVMLLDLYKMNKSSKNTNDFTNALNNSIISIKNEDKLASIINLSDLYKILPQFLNDISAKSEIISLNQTKSYILSAYSFANQSNWEMVAQELVNAENEFLKVMMNVKFIKNKENKINSIYVGIKELQSSLNTQDIEIFFINYKNLIERLNVL